MKINPPNSKAPSGSDQTAGVGAAAAGGSASKQLLTPKAASDQVQLSNMSSYLAAALAGSPAQVAKVSELSAAVSSGQYQVDAFAVSGSIIQHSIEFGGSTYSGFYQ
jgi:flagellar biosynthesis anti-sigma factor FlgM